MRKKILTVGSSNIDFVVGVENMPRKGETVRCLSFAKIPGGKGANQACAVGKLGGECVFLSAVGDDGLGDIVIESLRKSNVDVSRVAQVPNTPSGMAMITVSQDGENSIVVVPGANEYCNSSYYAKHVDALDEADIVLAQLETPVDDIYSLLKAAKQVGKTVILNPAPAPDQMPDDLLQSLDFITPNETELAKITGMPTQSLEQIEAAACALLKKGVGCVLVTIGSRGALLCNKDGCKRYPVAKVTPVDTTAAGDTFNAALAVALAENSTISDAIRLANAAAAISITRKGAQTSVPTREEVDIAMDNQR